MTIVDYSSIGSLRESRVVAMLQGHLYDEYAENYQIKYAGPHMYRVSVIEEREFVGELVEATVRCWKP